MSIKARYLTTLLAASAVSAAAIAVAPVAAGAPECTNTGPNTTQCETNGSAQIVTSCSPAGIFFSAASAGGASVGDTGLATAAGFG